jgi:hypothetical protein
VQANRKPARLSKDRLRAKTKPIDQDRETNMFDITASFETRSESKYGRLGVVAYFALAIVYTASLLMTYHTLASQIL